MGQAIDQAENTVAVSPEHFKKLLSTQVSSKTSSMDYAKNLQNLSRMIEAVTNGEVKKIGNRKLIPKKEFLIWLKEQEVNTK